MRPGKAKQGCETIRETPRKWKQHPDSIQETVANQFSECTGSHHRCILRSEYSRYQQVKIGSNKNCIGEDLAKEKKVFSKESSRAVFEMGNVERNELKKSSIQCPSYTTFFEGTLLCKCGKRDELD